MLISDALAFVGHFVDVAYGDQTFTAEVFDVNFIPLKGPCLITDQGDFRLDRIANCSLHAVAKSA